MSISTLYPNIFPSFVLDFVNTTATDPRMVAVRNSGATRVNEKGFIETVGNNQPRIDFDPITGKQRGLLTEEARTNFLTWSQLFINRTITVTGVVGTFQDGETVTATGGGSGRYSIVGSTSTVFALYAGSGTWTGTVTGSTSGATATITTTAGRWSIGALEVVFPVNSQVSPDGTSNAQVLNPTIAGTQVRNITHTYTTSTTGNYTFSIFVKKGTLSNNLVALRVRDVANANDFRANFNLSTLAIPTTAILGGVWTAGTPTITRFPNDWIRLSISGNCTGSFTGIVGELYVGGYQGTPETIGTVYIWGAQLEAGSFPTSYIPTIDATVSRVLENATVSNLVPWYNNTEGTVYAEFTARLGVSQTPVTFSNSSGQGFRVRKSSANQYVAVLRDGVTKDVGTTPSTALTDGQVIKIAVAVKENDCAVSGGGDFVATQTSMSPLVAIDLPLDIGYSSMDGNHQNGHICKIVYYPQRLTNNQLRALTV